MTTLPADLLPGQWGVTHGSGIVGELIRHATESWAGHAVIYIGNGQIVEATPPAARINSALVYDDIRWAHKMPISPAQQNLAIARAHALVGDAYDYPAYIGFALEVLKLRSGKELAPAFRADSWRVCSALVYDCQMYAQLPYDWSKLHLSPGEDPNLVSPGMLLDYGTVMEWM